ncbi:Thioredoxin-like_superfamily [Hexamita inflata]|uniref:Thioredoxin-like_superfamily n=1 Tax=Hexamita inflata TaxID=28002 RepID=A0ABP1M4G9_9EUKA
MNLAIFVLNNRLIQLTPEIYQSQYPILVYFTQNNSDSKVFTILNQIAFENKNIRYGQFDCVQHAVFCKSVNITTGLVMKLKSGNYTFQKEVSIQSVKAFISESLHPIFLDIPKSELHLQNFKAYFVLTGNNSVQHYDDLLFKFRDQIKIIFIKSNDSEKLQCYKAGLLTQHFGPFVESRVHAFIERNMLPTFTKNIQEQEITSALKQVNVMLLVTERTAESLKKAEKFETIAKENSHEEMTFGTISENSQEFKTLVTNLSELKAGDYVIVTKEKTVVVGQDAEAMIKTLFKRKESNPQETEKQLKKEMQKLKQKLIDSKKQL